MNAPERGQPGSQEQPSLIDGVTAGLWTVPAAIVAALVVRHEQWDPSADTGTNVIRGAMALGFTAMAVHDWRKFNQATDHE